ncbi:MAG: hypothetical protein KC492_02445, partial [Myxococcales bacterium]|nr:hypothetical protein [Myxococcales bacterium]
VLLSNVQRVGDLRGQLQLLDQQAEASEDVEQWAMLQLYAAQLLEWSLDQAGTAIERCFSVLERQPGNERARVLAQRIARYSGDWPSWLRLAEAMAAEDTQSLMRRAAVYEQHDPKSERALELYRRAHEQGDVSALWALASALRRRKQWQPWAELIERNIDVWRRSEEERIEALCLVAQLYELQPERRDRALRCYQRAFDLDQRNWYAREGLTRLLLENDQWVEAAAVLRQAVAAIESAGPRLLKGVAALNERVGLIDEAIEQYNSVRLRQEADVEANDALCRLVGRHQELEFDLERVWGELAELCQDPALEAALRLEQAVLRDAHSSLERDAEPLYRLLVRQPQTATVAAAALERSYGQRRDYARMAQLLEQPLHVAERPAERAHRLFRFAGCCWELGQLQPAADALVEVLDFREDFVTIRLLRHVSEGL